MLHTATAATQRRRSLREGLASGRLLRFPGAFNALCAMMVQRAGFDGVYVSGAVLSASLGLPDVGLTTASEVTARGQEIARVTDLPVLVDADTGFGEPLNAARTVQLMEDAGLSGCHIEDQVNPKRCGHLEGKEVVPAEQMTKRLAAAVGARRDPGFVVCARTDARALEGTEGAIERAKRYVDAGADMVFPEALADEREWEQFRKAIDVPLLANMTEFGRSRLLSATTLGDIGVNLVIYPVTLFRLAMGATERALRTIAEQGSQESLIAQMQAREELYEVLGYDGYGRFDSRVARGEAGVTTGQEEG